MTIFYELFDLATGNVIDDFAAEEDALEALRTAECEHGLAAISDVALLRYKDGHPTLVAMERDLVARVSESVAAEQLRVG
jgi:hypothetical protein